MPDSYESHATNCTIKTTGDLTADLPGESADEPAGTQAYDMTVVGAGAVDAAIARELAR